MNRDRLLRHATTSEDRMLLSRIADKLAKADKTGFAAWSVFLDPRQREMVEKALVSSCSDTDPAFRFDGGYEGAERVLCGFVPETEWGEDDDAPPLTLIQAQISGKGSGKALSHRDWLGALMGLGLKRETIGDILVRPNGADFLILEETSRIVLSQLDQVGAASVTLASADPEVLEVPERAAREIRTTVMSLRLDAVAAAAFSVSRNRMADWIRGEKVSLDWAVVSSPAAMVREGATISLRGKGRAVLVSVGGQSKKGRTGIVLQRLI